MNNIRSPALLLFAHGSRDPAWREPLDKVCQLIAVHHSGYCKLAFLEFMQPELSDALHALAQAGEQYIVVVPMFWASGKHIKTDLTEAIDRFSLAHPKVTVTVATALGEATSVQSALVDYTLSCVAMSSKL